MGIEVIGLVILIVLVALIWLAVYLSAGKSEAETKNDGLEYTLDIIEERKKKEWANEKLINSLSDAEFMRLQREFERKTK